MLLLVVITESSGRWGGEGLFGGGFVVIVFVEVDDDKSSSNDLDFDIPVAALLIGTGLLIDGDGFLCELLLVLLLFEGCLLYTSPSPRDATLSRMPSSA